MAKKTSYSRERAEAFLGEQGKRLHDEELNVRAGAKANFFPIHSNIEPNANLMIRLDPDGDYALQAFVPDVKAIICRWDRVPHRKPHVCEETGETITNGHKHYMADNVEGSQRIVKRGPNQIPTSTLQDAVRAFCKELEITPPKRVVSILGVALKEVA